MKNIGLRRAVDQDRDLVVRFDYRLDQVEHVELKREEKITKAIQANECFIILADNVAIGFAIFDYRFFDLGWIELIVIEEEFRNQGAGVQAIHLLVKQSKTKKIFTSTNRSNIVMQKALAKANFLESGELTGLDEGDPELFYYIIKD